VFDRDTVKALKMQYDGHPRPRLPFRAPEKKRKIHAEMTILRGNPD